MKNVCSHIVVVRQFAHFLPKYEKENKIVILSRYIVTPITRLCDNCTSDEKLTLFCLNFFKTYITMEQTNESHY